MKTFIKIVICLTVLSFNGCFNMYNEADEDMGSEYKYYIAIGSSASRIRMYSLDADQIPHYITYYTTPSGGTINNIAVHPNDNYIYVIDSDNDIIYTYQVDINASLIQIDSQNTGTDTDPYDVEVDPTGRYVYVSCSNVVNGNFILIYSVGNDGKLTSVGSGNTPPSSGPRLMAIHPSGRYLYVALNSGGGFSSFRVVSGGLLTLLGTTTVGNDTYDIIIHPSGNYLYVSTIAAGGANVYKYNIDSDGTIFTASKKTYTIIFENPFGYISLAIHSNGNYIYMKDGFSSRIFAFQIDVAGELTLVDQFPAASTIASGICNLIIHPNGRNIYMTERSGNDRFGYNIVLNNTGLFDDNFSYQEFGTVAHSNPIIIKKKIK